PTSQCAVAIDSTYSSLVSSFSSVRRPLSSTLFPYTTLFRSPHAAEGWERMSSSRRRMHLLGIFYYRSPEARDRRLMKAVEEAVEDRKSTRLNSSHVAISYAVACPQKKDVRLLVARREDRPRI